MTEEMRSMLMEMLTNRSGLANGLNMQEVLSRMGQSGANADLIAQYLTKSQAVTTEDDAEVLDVEFEEDDDDTLSDFDEPVLPREPIILQAEKATRSRVSEKLRAKIDGLMAELNEMRARNDTLAAALGACYLCWGANPTCQVCRGKGRPGAAIPDQKLFEQVVMPVVKKHYKREFSSQSMEGHTHRKL